MEANKAEDNLKEGNKALASTGIVNMVHIKIGNKKRKYRKGAYHIIFFFMRKTRFKKGKKKNYLFSFPSLLFFFFFVFFFSLVRVIATKQLYIFKQYPRSRDSHQ